MAKSETRGQRELRINAPKRASPGKKQRRAGKPADVDPAKILTQIDREMLIVVENGQRKEMSTLEVWLRQLWTSAIKGDLNSARLILKLSEKHLPTRQSNPIEIVVVPNDQGASTQEHS